jgi:hypothetical protein
MQERQDNFFIFLWNTMVHIRTIFWTTVAWLFICAAGIAYLRFFNVALVHEFFPNGDETQVCDTTTITTSTESDAVLQKLDDIASQLTILEENLQETQSSTTVQTTTQTSTSAIQKKEMDIKLFYFNQEQDSYLPADQQSNIASIMPVRRSILTNDPYTDAVQLLLQGDVTMEEKAQGFVTIFPRSDLTVASVAVTNGVATVTLNAGAAFSFASTVEANIVKETIRRTLAQFPEVQSVTVQPEILFQ